MHFGWSHSYTWSRLAGGFTIPLFAIAYERSVRRFGGDVTVKKLLPLSPRPDRGRAIAGAARSPRVLFGLSRSPPMVGHQLIQLIHLALDPGAITAEARIFTEIRSSRNRESWNPDILLIRCTDECHR